MMVWKNPMLTIDTKMQVYQAWVPSTLLHGSELWTLYSCQECGLNIFHLRTLRRIQCITWQDRVPKKDVLTQAGIPRMFALLTQCPGWWSGHIKRMDRPIPEDILYGTLAIGFRPEGRLVLYFKDVCKWDMRTGNIDPSGKEAVTEGRSDWRMIITKACIQRSKE